MSEARTVLIIDDDVAFADFLRAAVESVGHRAVVCHDGSHALEVFRDVKPGLVLLDILLPKRDGFQVCQDIRADEDGKTVPLVMITGIYKKPVYEREALSVYKASAYLYKPVQVTDLWALLERYLGSVQGDALPEAAEDAISLAKVPLAAVLAEHEDMGSSGVLFIRGVTESHAVYLRHGEPFFVRSNVEASRLHEVLIQTWQVTREQVDQALEQVASSRGRLRLGQALVSIGALSQEQFETALQLQLQIVLKHAFAMSDGTVFFATGEPPSAEDLPLELSSKAVLMMGARFAGSSAAVRTSLPPMNATLHRITDQDELLDELKLPPIDRAVFETVNGKQSVEQFLAVSRCAGADGTRLLLGLKLAGLVSHDQPKADGPSLMRPYSDWDAERWSHLTVGATVMDLHHRQATGTLAIRAGEDPATKTLIFRDGDLMGVLSDVEEDSLEDMILKLQLVAEDELAEIVDALGTEAGDRELGRALVLSGKTTPMQVYWAAVYQAQAATVGLLGLRGCTLTWNDQDAPEEATALPDIPTAEIVWEAARCLSGPELRTLLPGKQTWFQALPTPATALSKIPIPDAALTLFSQLARAATLDTLLKEGPAKGDELRRFLHGLLSCRLTETCEAPAPASAAAPTPTPIVASTAAPEATPARPVERDISSDDPLLDMLFGGASVEEPEPKDDNVGPRGQQEKIPPLFPQSPQTDTASDDALASLDLPATRDMVSELAADLKALLRSGSVLVPELATGGERIEVNRAALRTLLSAVADLSARAECLDQALATDLAREEEPCLEPEGAGVCP